MGVLFAYANSCSWSIAFSRYCQSFVVHRSTKFLSSSIKLRSTGFDTEVVRRLNVFCVPSKPCEEPWLLAPLRTSCCA